MEPRANVATEKGTEDEANGVNDGCDEYGEDDDDHVELLREHVEVLCCTGAAFWVPWGTCQSYFPSRAP